MPPLPPNRRNLDRALFLCDWRRSAKGNLWRRLSDGSTVTVFQKQDGRYGYCVYRDGPNYSHAAYRTEEEAQEAAWEWLEQEESG